MEVGNEMEIFITLNNTILANSRKVRNASDDYLVSINHPALHNSVQYIYEEWDITITVH